MAYKICEDCGTKMHGTRCPNCHEELVILEEQSEFISEVSQEFAEKAHEQSEQIKHRLER